MNTRYLLTGVVLIAALAGGIFWLNKNRPARPQPPAATAGQKAKIKGGQNASIQIVEYSDFQCPACQRSAQFLQQMMERFGDKTSLTFRHFPLAAHQGSPLAHQAAECADRQQKFWDYHDRLFAEQNQWAAAPNPSELFLTYAKDLGLDLDAFALCLADPKIRQPILSDKAEGESAQIKSTPTFFINGQRAVGLIELQKKMQEMTGVPLSPAPASETAAPPSGNTAGK